MSDVRRLGAHRSSHGSAWREIEALDRAGREHVRAVPAPGVQRVARRRVREAERILVRQRLTAEWLPGRAMVARRHGFGTHERREAAVGELDDASAETTLHQRGPRHALVLAAHEAAAL